jgi:hypothetical protein
LRRCAALIYNGHSHQLFSPGRALPSKQLLSRCALHGAALTGADFALDLALTDAVLCVCGTEWQSSGRCIAVERDGRALKWIGNLPSRPDTQVA